MNSALRVAVLKNACACLRDVVNFYQVVADGGPGCVGSCFRDFHLDPTPDDLCNAR